MSIRCFLRGEWFHLAVGLMAELLIVIIIFHLGIMNKKSIMFYDSYQHIWLDNFSLYTNNHNPKFNSWVIYFMEAEHRLFLRARGGEHACNWE